ncbi:MAG: MgtC/SapB family protein [Ruminococcus sp.]|nr:MgtC/SapB family protein [Candidatus Copronaster equi]
MNSLFHFLDPIRGISFLSLFIKIFLAVFFGGLIGLERGQKHRAAGSRTYMIVCLGATLTLILAQYNAFELSTRFHYLVDLISAKTDVTRFASKAVGGIGFLGAGTIIVTGRQEVKGLTTAAGLWASACMGIAIGAGFYECAILGFILIVVTTVFFNKIGSWIVLNARNMDVYVEFDTMENLGEIINTVKNLNIQIFDVDIQKEKTSNGVTIGAVLSTRLPKGESHSHVMSKISKFDFVRLVDEI